jgi:predicted RNA-binding protein with PIN domain
MRFLIDGYNLLHAGWPAYARHARARAWPRLRQLVLDRLRDRHGAAAADVTVVFDARHAPRDAEPVEDRPGLHVRFAVGYPSADDLIEELIRTDAAPAGLTVVSDDRRLRDAARRRGCTVARCLDYLEALDRPPPRPPDAAEPPGKPEEVSPEEVEQWLREFGET